MTDSENNQTSYAWCRRVHLFSSGGLLLIAVVHSCLTPIMYPGWSPESVWFLGTGIGLLLLSVLNLTHIGVEPCHERSTRLVRGVNWLFLLFGISTLFAVPEPQAFLVVLCFAGQAVASRWTLPGPG